VPRLHRISRQTITIARAVEVNQANGRGLVTSSKCSLQARVTQDNDNEVGEAESKPSLIKSRVEDKLDRLLYKLDLEMRRTGRVINYDLRDVIATVKRTNFCTSTQALLLIRCCGKAITDETKLSRRERVAEVIPMLKSLLSLDVSHYNAILKVHVENEQSVDVSEFLGEMEAGGVKPNRATYQHLIGIYCQDGNIAGATTVLEQMKAEDMSINESIFHFLLIGHCINHDKVSVNETLEVMENSGLLLGSETYTTMLTALAKARDWERVEEVLVEANNKDVRLDAGDYFKVIIALCENGMAEQAKPLVSKIPRRAGYFQELRCALPQIILTGQCDLAFEIFNGFKVSGSDDRSRTNHGMFMVRALVNSPTEPAEAAEYIMQMMDSGYTDALSIYAQECINLDRDKHIIVLGNMIKEKGSDLPRFDTRNILRKKMNSPEELGKAIKSLQQLGVRVEYGTVAREMIQRSLDLDAHTPGALAQQLKKEVPMIPIGYIQNNMMATLLERSKHRFMQACTGYLLYTRMDQVFPGFWSSHLARSYLRTNSLDDLVSIIFATKIKIKDSPTDMENLYHVLLELDRYQVADQPEGSASAILATVVAEINKHKIGIPRSTADKINELLAEPELQTLLEVAVADFENTEYWTEERVNSFLEKRKDVYRKSFKNSGYRAPVSEDRMYTGYFEIPDDLDEMLKIKGILKRRGTFNPKLADMLIRKFGEEGEPDRCLVELAEAQAAEDTFQLNPVSINLIVNSYIKTNNVDGALKFFTDTNKDSFASTYIDILEAYAKQGEHEKVVELLGAPQEMKLINAKDIRNYQSLLDIYQEAGNAENLQKVVNQIIEIRLEKGNVRPLLHSLVKVHLVNDDVPAALEAFKALVEQYKCLPGKSELMTRLVRDENVDDLQKVIDLSISVIGEELSLYDLTEIFLAEGRRAQAQRMLETPGLMYNHRAVTNIMDAFVRNNQLNCLEDLVKLSKNVFGCDRDHMYQIWVKAVSKKAEVVNEIWMEIQEEGHAPSTKLKTEIARSLQAGNLEIPFVTSDLDLEGPRMVKEEKVSKNKNSGDVQQQQITLKPALSESKQEKKQSDQSKTKEELAAVIGSNDIAKLVELLKQDSRPVKDLWEGLQYLTEQKAFSQAIDVIKHINYKPNKLKTTTSNLIEKMVENNQRAEAEAFIAEMPENIQRSLMTNVLLANINAKDPERLYESIKTASPEERVKSFVPIKLLNETFAKDVKIRNRLEELAVTGHIPAAVLMGRHACAAGEVENLVKHWSSDPREDKARSYIVEVRSLDRLRWVCDTLNYDKDVVRVASNQCLAFNKEGTREILEFSLQNGLNLEDVNTTALKRVAALQDFPHSADAARLVEERKTTSTTTTAK